MRRGTATSVSGNEMGETTNSVNSISYATNSAGLFARRFKQFVRWAAQYGALAAAEKYYAEKASCQFWAKF